MKRHIGDIDDCFGCFLCETVCPQKCIQKTKNANGFYFPDVTEECCIHCGKCVSVCPSKQQWGSKPLEFVGARYKNSDVLKNSTSGGVFTAITDWILSNNGVIFGATYDDQYTVVHTCASNYESRDKMRGAKYVKSETLGIFAQVEQAISQGRLVLFSGTPCQIAAIRSFCMLRKLSLEQIFTIDLICHGTPSPEIFSDYLRILQKKYGKIVSYTFRDKEVGWHGQNVTAKFESGKKVNKGLVTYFSTLYFRSYITMEYCHSCKYASLFRVGDITLGDFWGVEKYYPQYSDNQGVSLVMINSERGKLLFDAIKENLDYWQTTEHECLQQNLIAPSEPNKHKKTFYKFYRLLGFRGAYYFTRIFQFVDDVVSKIQRLRKKTS